LVRRSHCAVEPTLGWVVFPERTTLATVKRHNEIHSSSLVSLRVLPSHYLAGSPQRISASHGLHFPTALSASKVRFSRALPPPAIFRLQGLITLLTVFTLRYLASLVSYRLRSWDYPFGAFPSRKVSASFPTRKNPHTVHSSVYPRTEVQGPA
jgi:hypothetical protein